MLSPARPWLAVLVVVLAGLSARAQSPAPRTPTPPPPPPPQLRPAGSVQPAAAVPASPTVAIAATVNGQPIAETAVQRGLKRVPPARHAEARPEILEYLIDNLLIEQYLVQLGVTVDRQEVDARIQQIREEIKKQGQTFEKVMQELMLGEDELRVQIAADLRWDRYATQQATEPALHDLFTQNRDMFDGSMVRARHILLTPANDATAGEQAKAQLMLYRKQIEDQVNAGLAKLPATADKLAREQARSRLADDAFAALAREKSACPSKENGGDVGWFPRAGSMVEPFARAAFALKPCEMSDVVKSQFGYHLILTTDRRPGKDVKFEEVKEEVQEVFCDRLRETLAGRLRQTAKIAVAPAPKP